MKLLLLRNPATAEDDREAIDAGVAALVQSGHEVVDVELGGPGEATRIARERGADFDRLIACGGDGTVAEVAAGLLQGARQVPLVVAAAGTGNDLARAIHPGHGEYAPMPIEDSLRMAAEGEVRALDVGLAGERPFFNAVSGGIPAEVSGNASPELKSLLGPLAYVASGIAKVGQLRAFDLRLSGEAGAYEGAVLFFAVANGQSVGGGSRIAPSARVDDGLLDVVILPALPAGALIGAVRALRAGADHPALVRMRGRRFELEAEEEIPLTIDGEPAEAGRLSFSLLPGALRLVSWGEAPALTSPRGEECRPA